MTSKQRAYLRSLSNGLDAIFQLGKEGISDNFIEQLNAALEVRELIKIHVLETCEYTVREASNALCEACEAEPVQCIGGKMVLYKPSKKNPQIKLPKA